MDEFLATFPEYISLIRLSIQMKKNVIEVNSSSYAFVRTCSTKSNLLSSNLICSLPLGLN